MALLSLLSLLPPFPSGQGPSHPHHRDGLLPLPSARRGGGRSAAPPRPGPPPGRRRRAQALLPRAPVLHRPRRPGQPPPLHPPPRRVAQVEEADGSCRRGLGGDWEPRRGEGRVPLVLPQGPEAGEAGAREVRAVRAPAHLWAIVAPQRVDWR